ncbi:hypothetical protein BU17DRAFT_98717 [Hysterangium stoloniferum]|nr:hypothetical protein BU17DRAFT_98717 [Hysterangium stoloniferum]
MSTFSSSLAHHPSQHLTSSPEGGLRPSRRTRAVKDVTIKYPNIDQALIESFVTEFENINLTASSRSCIDACITKLKTLNLISDTNPDTDDAHPKKTPSRAGRNSTPVRQKFAPYQKRASRSESLSSPLPEDPSTSAPTCNSSSHPPRQGKDAKFPRRKMVDSRWGSDAKACAKVSLCATGPSFAYRLSTITWPSEDRVRFYHGPSPAPLGALRHETWRATTEDEYDDGPYPDINYLRPNTDDTSPRKTPSRAGRNSTPVRQKFAPYQKRASRSESFSATLPEDPSTSAPIYNSSSHPPRQGKDAQCPRHKMVDSRWGSDAKACAKVSLDATGPSFAYRLSTITWPSEDRVRFYHGPSPAPLEALRQETWRAATEDESDDPDINYHLRPAVWSPEDYSSSDTNSSSSNFNSDSDFLLGNDDLQMDDDGMNQQAPMAVSTISYQGNFYPAAYETDPALLGRMKAMWIGN